MLLYISIRSEVIDMISAGYADCHIHTEYSFDSEAKIDDICKAAISRGMRAVSITDHCEICTEGFNKNEFWSMKTMKQSYEAARKAKEKYAGKLEVCAGIELGQPHHAPELAREVLAQCDYDIVLASVHYLRDHRDFYYLDYINENDPYEVYKLYFSELREVLEFGSFDSLAHLTYPLRYIIGRAGIDFDEKRFAEDYDNILSALAQSGKALEINVSGGRKIRYIVPDVPLLSRFRELGGKYITIGSDAHRAEAAGDSVDEGVQMARSAGFDRVVYYRNHQSAEIMI